MGMTVCSGIGAPEVAAPFIDWHWQSEIEKFPSAVLAARFPHAVNLGDMTKFQEWPDANPDVLVGGTPCQSFSVAGLRRGMADPRGNLALTYLAIADRYRPAWLVWENVPGVLSSNGGRDFGSFLGGMAELGYGFAYRVLDAQYVRVESHARAVPQRRRRVFVVGHLGDWRRAAAVLFERESLSGHSPPRRETGKGFTHGVAPSLTGSGRSVERSGETRGQDPVVAVNCADVVGALSESSGHARPGDNMQSIGAGYLISSTAMCLNAGAMGRQDAESETLIPTTGGDFDVAPVAYRTTGNDGAYETGDIVGALNTATDPNQHVLAIQGAATRENPSSGPDGIGVRTDGAAYTLEARQEVQAVAFDLRGREGGAQFEGPHDTANIRAASGGSSRSYVASMAVRRLTPLECEHLQGFPDGHTAITFRGKPAADGPRYKGLGNSMAVNVMNWILTRIAEAA